MRKIKVDKSLMDKFILEIARIKDPVVFLGVARVLKVRAVGDDKETKDFNELFQEVLEAFQNSSKTRQKELLSILKNANRAPAPKRGGLNGNNTEHTEEAVSDEDVRPVPSSEDN